MIKQLVNNYIKWLSDNITLKKIGNYTEITTPFLDNHNDWINIYVSPLQSGQYKITDDGYSVSNLEMCGVEIKDKRKNIFEAFLRGYGVSFNEETKEIFVCTNQVLFPQKNML